MAPLNDLSMLVEGVPLGLAPCSHAYKVWSCSTTEQETIFLQKQLYCLCLLLNLQG